MYFHLLCKHDRIAAVERRKRFAQAPGRQQPILKVLRCDQNNVEVARKRTVLEAIV